MNENRPEGKTTGQGILSPILPFRRNSNLTIRHSTCRHRRLLGQTSVSGCRSEIKTTYYLKGFNFKFHATTFSKALNCKTFKWFSGKNIHLKEDR